MPEGIWIAIISLCASVLGALITKLIDHLSNKRYKRAQTNNMQMDTVSKLQSNYIEVLDQLAEERERYTKEMNDMNEKISKQNKLIDSQKELIKKLQDSLDEANNKIDEMSHMLQLACVKVDCPVREKYLHNK